VTLEGLQLEGSYPLALWSILKPRDAHAVNGKGGEAQDCVSVNYVLVGRIGNQVLWAEGLRTLTVPDHALGRVVERSGLMPDAIITDAHHNLLSLSASAITQTDGHIHSDRHFLVKAGDGGFRCFLRIAPDVSLDHALDARVHTVTWIANDMLYEDQTLLVGNGLAGDQLGDGYLLPPAMRRFVKDGSKAHLHVLRQRLPRLIGASVGRA
jgi:hypothetical protein